MSHPDGRKPDSATERKPDRTAGAGVTFADRCRELLAVQEEIAAAATPRKPALTQDEALSRLAGGVPLLSFGDFFPGWQRAKPAFQRLLTWVAAAPGGDHHQERTTADMDELHFLQLALLWYRGRTNASPERSQVQNELGAIVGACVRPFLQAHSRMVMSLVDQALWRRRSCPACGGSPDIAYLDRENGARWLVCSRCDAEWLFQRLQCPYCGTDDTSKLSYFTDDAGRYRLCVCDACRTFLKVVDRRRGQCDATMSLERFLTMDMDRQARESGYLPGN